MLTFIPPLGSRHVVSRNGGDIAFSAFNDTDSTAEVWTNASGTWQAHSFEQQTGLLAGVSIARVTLSTNDSEILEYTYRLRDAAGGIQWLGSGGNNGTLVVADAKSDFNEVRLEGLDNTRIYVTSPDEDDIKVLRFALNPGSEGDIDSVCLGTIAGCTSGSAVVRTKPTWFESVYLPSLHQLPSLQDTQLLLIQTDDSTTVILPVSQSTSAATLRGDLNGSGQIWLCATREPSDEKGEAFCIVASCQQSRTVNTVARCVQVAGRLVDEHSVNAAQDDGSPFSEAPEAQFDTSALRFCTWNSCGPNYALSDVLDRLEQLKSAGDLDKYDSVLLDDGWQDTTDARTLRSFGLKTGWDDVESDNASDLGESTSVVRTDSGFLHSRNTSVSAPSGAALQRAVKVIRDRYPNIKSVGVWMTIQGYWRGLDGTSSAFDKYKPQSIALKVNAPDLPADAVEQSMFLPALEKVSAFWDDYLFSLREAGISYVKIDNQAGLEYLDGPGSSALRTSISRTARAIAIKHFGSGKLINCMAHSPRHYCEFMSERSDPLNPLRTSDDFFPDQPDSHRHHIANNATLATLHRAMRVVPDFDMFMSQHQFSDYHARLRAFTNSAVYMTDNQKPDEAILSNLGGHDANGRYRVVKAADSQAARLHSRLFEDVTMDGPGPALLFSLPCEAAGGVDIGIWNCLGQDATTADILTTADVQDALTMLNSNDFCKDDTFVLSQGSDVAPYVRSGSKLFGSSRRQLHAHPIQTLELHSATSQTLSIAVAREFEGDLIAILGLQDKYSPLSSILSVSKATLTQGSPDDDDSKDAVEPAIADEPQKEDADTRSIDSRQSQIALLTRSRFGLGRSRFLGLLFFWRAQLRAARSTLLRDLLTAPLKTLVVEMAAVFGRRATLPQTRPATTLFAPSGVVPAQSSGEVATEAPQPEAARSEDQDDKTATSESLPALAIEVAVAGRLAVYVAKGNPSTYGFAMAEVPVNENLVTVNGNMLTLDLDGYRKSQTRSESTSTSSAWLVKLYRRS